MLLAASVSGHESLAAAVAGHGRRQRQVMDVVLLARSDAADVKRRLLLLLLLPSMTPILAVLDAVAGANDAAAAARVHCLLLRGDVMGCVEKRDGVLRLVVRRRGAGGAGWRRDAGHHHRRRRRDDAAAADAAVLLLLQ